MMSQESHSGDDLGTLFSQSIKRKKFAAPKDSENDKTRNFKSPARHNIVPPPPSLEFLYSQQSQSTRQNQFQEKANENHLLQTPNNYGIGNRHIYPVDQEFVKGGADQEVMTVSTNLVVKRRLFDDDNEETRHTSHNASIQEIPGRQFSNQISKRNDSVRQKMCVETPSDAKISVPCSGGNRDGNVFLRPVSEIPEKYRKIFDFPYFNIVQSKVFDDALYSDKPLVVCAPTGSGKTVLFELAIIRLLLCNGLEADLEYKIVYMAPIKALCSERHKDWSTKFEPCGLKCTELTGDTDLDDFHVLQYAHIVLTTPEKWDSMTRKWKDHKSLVQSVRLFLIDEVHLLSDENRGATMEAVVSRMKTVQCSIAKEKLAGGPIQAMRIIAVSATIPNVEDMADWLTIDGCCAKSYCMGDEYRPVSLRKVVLGYPYNENTSDFKFDLSLNYKLSGIIQTYSECKPTLVFCSTRKGATQAAATLTKDARFIMDSQHKSRLMKYSNTLHDAKLRDLILYGVGYHHAGMDVSDRKNIESMFVRGELPVLFCTSTLAMGVNLPAHLVVVKSTMHYVIGMYEEYTESQVLQMIGRAGRPQYDTSATAVIMTKASYKSKYQALVNGMQKIESSLHRNLTEHINAEIVLGTIPNTYMAEEWLKSTFLYKRMQKNPSHYGAPEGLSEDALGRKLQAMGLRALRSLQSLDLLEIKENGSLIPTDTGKLMARYCIVFDTVKSFSKVKGTESLEELVEILSKSKEFEDINLRVNEKKILNTLNKDKHRVTIRFPMKNKIKTTDQKINCLIQAVLGCLTINEFSLMQDITKIFRSGQRVSRFLSEFLMMKGSYRATLNALILNKCIRVKLWENTKFVSRQLEKIGATMSTALVHAGLTTLEKIESINPRELEMIVNRHPPFGSQVKDSLAALPKYDISIDQDENYQQDTAELYLKITMLNAEHRSKYLKNKKLVYQNSSLFMIADASNCIVYKQRLMDRVFFNEGSWSKHIRIKRAHKNPELTANLISSDYVGVDLQLSFTPNYIGGFPSNAHDRTPNKETGSWMLEDQKENRLRDSDGGRRKSCTHRCINKDWCGHQCCKYGVAVKEVKKRQSSDQSLEQHQERQNQEQTPIREPKRPAKRKGSAVDGFLENLSNKKTSLPNTSGAKRIKYQGTMYDTKEIEDDAINDLLQSAPSPSSVLNKQFSYIPRKVSFKQYLKQVNQADGLASPNSSPPAPRRSRNKSSAISDNVYAFQRLRSGIGNSMQSYMNNAEETQASHKDIFVDNDGAKDEIDYDFNLLDDGLLDDDSEPSPSTDIIVRRKNGKAIANKVPQEHINSAGSDEIYYHLDDDSNSLIDFPQENWDNQLEDKWDDYCESNYALKQQETNKFGKNMADRPGPRNANAPKGSNNGCAPNHVTDETLKHQWNTEANLARKTKDTNWNTNRFSVDKDQSNPASESAQGSFSSEQFRGVFKKASNPCSKTAGMGELVSTTQLAADSSLTQKRIKTGPLVASQSTFATQERSYQNRRISTIQQGAEEHEKSNSNPRATHSVKCTKQEKSLGDRGPVSQVHRNSGERPLPSQLQSDYYDIEDSTIDDSPFRKFALPASRASPLDSKEYNKGIRNSEAIAPWQVQKPTAAALSATFAQHRGHSPKMGATLVLKENGPSVGSVAFNEVNMKIRTQIKNEFGNSNEKSCSFTCETKGINNSVPSMENFCSLQDAREKKQGLDRSLKVSWFVEESKCTEDEDNFDFCDI